MQTCVRVPLTQAVTLPSFMRVIAPSSVQLSAGKAKRKGKTQLYRSCDLVLDSKLKQIYEGRLVYIKSLPSMTDVVVLQKENTLYRPMFCPQFGLHNNKCWIVAQILVYKSIVKKSTSVVLDNSPSQTGFINCLN